MRTLICLVLAASLLGCVPIGIRGSSAPLRGAGIGERPTVAAIDGRVAGRMNSALRNPSPWETQSRFPITSLSGALRNGSHVSQAAEHHRRDPRKQQGADLEAGKVVDAAKTQQDGDRA